MLSYRHAFHAGNFADVLKHIVLIEVLEHLIKKDKPFDYIDTHAGAGLYHLLSEHAKKLAEYKYGFAKLKPHQFLDIQSYFNAVDTFNTNKNTLEFYPGSPLIASQFLRKQDRAWCYELHANDYALLCKNFSGKNKVNKFEDGFNGLLSLVPPVSRRGVVLVDPSYEIKTDYHKVFDYLQKAYKKFSTGTYILWYPVVERDKIDKLERKFKSSGIKNIQLFELGLSEDSNQLGMTSAGVIVINPPWTLFDKMQSLLVKLVDALKDESNNPQMRCERIVDE